MCGPERSAHGSSGSSPPGRAGFRGRSEIGPGCRAVDTCGAVTPRRIVRCLGAAGPAPPPRLFPHHGEGGLQSTPAFGPSPGSAASWTTRRAAPAMHLRAADRRVPGGESAVRVPVLRRPRHHTTRAMVAGKSRRRRGESAVPARLQHARQGAAIADAQFGVRPLQVSLDGARRQVEPLCDGRRGQPLRSKAGHLSLAARERQRSCKLVENRGASVLAGLGEQAGAGGTALGAAYQPRVPRSSRSRWRSRRLSQRGDRTRRRLGAVRTRRTCRGCRWRTAPSGLYALMRGWRGRIDAT
jgi:hypothetical protein